MRHSIALLRLAAFGLLGSCGAGEELSLPDTGELTVMVSTDGDQVDSDGYTLSVDGGANVPLAVRDTLPIGDLGPGEHRLELGGLAANCSVTGPNPLTITVVLGSPVAAAFRVSCLGSSGTGRVVVRVVTTGTAPDPDGYEALVDSLPPRAVGLTDTATFEQLTADTHAVRLDGLAPQCEVRGRNPRSVEVTAEPVTTLFEVSCWPPPSGTVAFLRGEAGLSEDLFVVNADGTGLRNLTGTPLVEKLSVDGSPDGTTLAYDELTEIFLVPRSGAEGPTPLVAGNTPRWAPDGTRIAFRGGVITLATGEVQTLAPASPDRFAGPPAWSPDSRHIAFVASLGDGIVFSLDLAEAGGSQVRTVIDQSRLSGGYVVHGWQPDGSKLLVTVSGEFDELYLVDTASSIAPINLTESPAESYDAASWSPDGSMILFVKWPAEAEFLEREIYTLRLSDGTLTKLSPRPGGYIDAVWSPDGTHVVYVEEKEFLGPSHLFIVNADATGLRQLTAGRTLDREPVWAP